MRNLVREGKKNLLVRQTALLLIEGLPQKFHIGEIKRLFNFVKNRIRYVKDIRGIETLHSPEILLKLKQGDCDDKSILLASLLESIGYQTRFVALGFQPPIKTANGFKTKNYSHVFVEVFNKGKWIPLETTENVKIGWTPKNAQSALIIYNGDNISNISALAGKRVDNYINALAAELEKARAVADSEDATEEDIEKALRLEKNYASAIASYEAGARKKAKGIIPQLIKAQERKIKFFAKLKLPTFATHVKHAERKRRAQAIKLEVMRLQGQPRSPERDKKLSELSTEITQIAKKEKQYMKQGVIVAAILSVVIGIFTFGGGSVAVQGAFQALKEGAVNIAKGILLAAVKSAITKGASKKDVEQATTVANDLEKFPPDPSLKSLNEMIEDSQRKKLEASGVSKIPNNVWMLPAGIFAAIALLS